MEKWHIHVFDKSTCIQSINQEEFILPSMTCYLQVPLNQTLITPFWLSRIFNPDQQHPQVWGGDQKTMSPRQEKWFHFGGLPPHHWKVHQHVCGTQRTDEYEGQCPEWLRSLPTVCFKMRHKQIGWPLWRFTLFFTKPLDFLYLYDNCCFKW